MHQIACRISSLNVHKFSGEWLVELPPQISSPLYLGSGFALNSQALRAIGSGFILNFSSGDTINSSQVDGVRGRWEGGVGMGPHNCI